MSDTREPDLCELLASDTAAIRREVARECADIADEKMRSLNSDGGCINEAQGALMVRNAIKAKFLLP